jgi:PII-like signaling protein
MIPERAMLLRIFVGEDQQHDGRPAYEAIVLKARELNLAGATVLRGPIGYGASARLRSAHPLQLSSDLPLVIEIVDAADKINAFLPEVRDMVRGGLVTLEDVQVRRYGPKSGDRASSGG